MIEFFKIKVNVAYSNSNFVVNPDDINRYYSSELSDLILQEKDINELGPKYFLSACLIESTNVEFLFFPGEIILPPFTIFKCSRIFISSDRTDTKTIYNSAKLKNYFIFHCITVCEEIIFLNPFTNTRRPMFIDNEYIQCNYSTMFILFSAICYAKRFKHIRDRAKLITNIFLKFMSINN